MFLYNSQKINLIYSVVFKLLIVKLDVGQKLFDNLKLTFMREIVILIPDTEPEQNVEIDVRINGRKKTLQYRVELVSWEGTQPSNDEKFTKIKHKIEEYDQDWELVEIGSPDNENIPLMFRKRRITNGD